jgi:hypothetical protein
MEKEIIIQKEQNEKLRKEKSDKVLNTTAYQENPSKKFRNSQIVLDHYGSRKRIV